MAPQDHKGTDGVVTIDIKSQGGSGTTINYWVTKAVQGPNLTVCNPIAEFLINGGLFDYWASSDCLTTGPNQGVDWWATTSLLPYTFASGTKACNIWAASGALPGKPCATIHS
jgi:hypothetical protein